MSQSQQDHRRAQQIHDRVDAYEKLNSSVYDYVMRETLHMVKV